MVSVPGRLSEQEAWAFFEKEKGWVESRLWAWLREQTLGLAGNVC